MLNNVLINCPMCGGIIQNAVVMSDHQFEKYGIKKRTIAGHCCKCNQTIEIIQWDDGSGYITTDYRRYVLKPEKWQHVAEIPMSHVMLGDCDEKPEELIGSEK